MKTRLTYGDPNRSTDLKINNEEIILSFGMEVNSEFSVEITDRTLDGRPLPAPYITVYKGDEVVWDGYWSDFLKVLEKEKNA